MKNFLLLCAMVCVSAFACINKTYAQDTKTRFGIKAGIDWMTLGSTTQNNTKLNYGYRTGFQAGVYADVPLATGISFLPQVLYTQKGGSMDNVISIADYNTVVNSKLNYLDVPLLIGFKPQPNLTFSAGPQVAFFLSQQSVLNVSGGNSSLNNTATANFTTNNLRKVVIGGNVGVDYIFKANVGLGLHYSIDAQHAGNNGTSSNNNGQRNSGFALTLSYLF